MTDTFQTVRTAFAVVASSAAVFVSVPAAAADARSPSGLYTVDVERRFEAGQTRLVVRRVGRGANTVVARIDPNPGGHVRESIRVRFVAGDNVFASWGCGTYCMVATLHTPNGRELASLGIHAISPSGRFVVEYPAFDGPLEGAVRVLDLRTGRVLYDHSSTTAWNTCAVRWGRASVTLVPCDARTRPAVIERKDFGNR